jgi:hypothetical protein
VVVHVEQFSDNLHYVDELFAGRGQFRVYFLNPRRVVIDVRGNLNCQFLHAGHDVIDFIGAQCRLGSGDVVILATAIHR